MREKKMRFGFLTGLLSIMLLLASCGAAGQQEAYSPEDVLNPDKFNDQLTIRYFYLPSDEEKSGDAALIRTPDGVTMMVDAGVPKTGPYVDQYLDKLGIDKIDVAVMTHPHYDHIGGYTTLMHTKEIGKAYTTRVPHDTATYRTVESLIQEKNIPREYLEDGHEFMLGEHVKVQVLNPPKGTTDEPLTATSHINNTSFVLKMTYKDKTFLFTGDLYKAGESDVLERHAEFLDADFMDAPHHGDTTSNSSAFIDAVSPDVVVFSTNIFQSLRVEERYKSKGADVYVTGLNGNILITSDGTDLNVITEKERPE